MDIPLAMLLLLCIIFLVIGAVTMLLLQYYVYLKISMLPEESEEQRSVNAKYSLPMAVQQTARSLNASAGTPTAGSAADMGSLVAINFVMQFLFHELKNSSRVRKWFYRKLSLELDELIAKTTTGKLFDKLTIKELQLGDQFPEIKALRVHNVELDETAGRIENLDLLLDIRYAGNFHTSIDADMVLGKKGSLTLKVKQLSGVARLQFTRKPYTHWSLSFLGDPEIDLAIESKYQGRQMQSNITSLISNQIRKAVRRKHTLPNYKLRYKPFFHHAPDEDAGDGDIQPNGLLEVKVSELSRLMCPAHITDVYCTITLASLPFVEAHQKDDRNVLVSMDVQIHKTKNQQIGIIFKQTSEQCVEIEAVLPNTPACKSNLRAGDILVGIEGKSISSIQQVAKVVKGLNNAVFHLRIERIIPGIIRNDAILEDLELYEDLGDIRTGYGSRPLEAELNVKQFLGRHSSTERGTSSESSLSNTPTNSPKKSKLIAKALKKTIIRENSDGAKDEEKRVKLKLSVKGEERPRTPVRHNSTSGAGDGVNDVEHYYQHSTVDCRMAPLIHMEDLSQFKLDANARYLNVCVYGKSAGECQLLGFVNVPITQVIAEHCETSLSQCWKTCELNPPVPQSLKTHPLSSQSGFNSHECFGDILFAFSWDGNPALAMNETPAKQAAKGKGKATAQTERPDDSGISDGGSLKSSSTESSLSQQQSRAHNFIRTHFQRATQCDFCGKKIWLKDAVQCRDCSMCCHKKCVSKCQNSTVCGPVDCSAAGLQSTTPTLSTIPATPEFTVTEASEFEAVECEEFAAAVTPSGDEEKFLLGGTSAPALEVHRSSLTGLLAQGIKRVNSVNNLAIPGIVSTLAGVGTSTGTGGAGGAMNAKSLPPTPQHSPSRKSSLVAPSRSPFEVATQRLEALPLELSSLTPEQINAIAEPIVSLGKEEDVMTLAKAASRQLYADVAANERVLKINALLSKLRLALDSETAIHSTLTAPPAVKAEQLDGSPQRKAAYKSAVSVVHSEERIQALSVIMLYLCTGLQHAQGVACK